MPSREGSRKQALLSRSQNSFSQFKTCWTRLFSAMAGGEPRVPSTSAMMETSLSQITPAIFLKGTECRKEPYKSHRVGGGLHASQMLRVERSAVRLTSLGEGNPEPLGGTSGHIPLLKCVWNADGTAHRAYLGSKLFWNFELYLEANRQPAELEWCVPNTPSPWQRLAAAFWANGRFWMLPKQPYQAMLTE